MLYFFSAIAVGSLLLLLPFSMRTGAPSLSVVDALFTATSAMCVTGLGVRGTGDEFSLFGQVVILLLIQLGGIGILAFSNIVFMAKLGAFSLRERSMLSATVGAHPQVSPAQLVFRVFQFVFITEAIGAVILSVRFSFDHPLGSAIWLGVFHSVSAFCNAGFSLFPDNLIGYRRDLTVNLTIMALIIAGGIGFIVVAEMTALAQARRKKSARVRLSLHSQVVLRTTAALIVVGWLLLLFVQQIGSSGGSTYEMLLESLFWSVTARTAGFNTADVGALPNAGVVILMLLMVIGGSPGSTAGGIKTTTFATLVALIRSRAANRPKVELLHRTLSHEVQGKALAGVAGFFLMTIGATILLELLENWNLPHAATSAVFLPHLFEVISALATAGLSTGITADLSSAGKLVIIICMFVGRLGLLMVASSVIGGRRRLDYSYPEERLMVG